MNTFKAVTNQRGITLIAVVMAVLAIGVIAYFAGALAVKMQQIAQERNTVNRMKVIEVALRKYYLGHRDLPAPSPTFQYGGQDQGAPVTDLSLEQKYASDSWGQRFYYNRVTVNVTTPVTINGITDILGLTVDGKTVAGVILSGGPNQQIEPGTISGTTYTTTGDDIVVPIHVQAEAIEIANNELCELAKKACAYKRASYSPNCSGWPPDDVAGIDSIRTTYSVRDLYALDPWLTPYEFQDCSTASPRVISAGPDRILGTTSSPSADDLYIMEPYGFADCNPPAPPPNFPILNLSVFGGGGINTEGPITGPVGVGAGPSTDLWLGNYLGQGGSGNIYWPKVVACGNVTVKFHLYGDIHCTGNVVVENGGQVSGNIVADGNVDVQSGGSVDGNVDCSGTVSGATRIGGTVHAGVDVSSILETPPGGCPQPTLPCAYIFSATPPTTNVSIPSSRMLAPSLPSPPYGILTVQKDSNLFLSAGRYEFRSIRFGNDVNLYLDLSNGDISIFVWEDVEIGSNLDVFVCTSGSCGNTPSNYTTITSVDSRLAAKVYLETRSTWDMDRDGEWFGTIMANDDITFENNCNVIGAVFGRNLVRLNAGFNITPRYSNYANYCWNFSSPCPTTYSVCSY